MSDKKLELGWSCHEIIGVSVINPRGIASTRRKYRFSSDTGSLLLDEDGASFLGTIEGAAIALANDVLEAKMSTENTDLRIYFSQNGIELIGIRRENGTYVLYYLEPQFFQNEVWAQFKAAVEKICNGLTIFI